MIILKGAKLILIAISVFIVLFYFYLLWLERRNLYSPAPLIEATPADYGWPYEEAWTRTSDGHETNGWFIPAPKDAPANRRGLVLLYCHGNGGNIGDRLEKFRVLRSLGVTIYVFDYRGYGKSRGRPTEQGTYADALGALDDLVSSHRIDPRRIIVYGESLGGAIAVHVAKERPVGGLILEGTFSSTVEVARHYYPWLPASLIIRNRYDSLSKIPGIHCPLLQFHSPNDDVVPFPLGKRLFAAAPDPKTFFELIGTHNEAYQESGPAYLAALDRFLSSI